MLYSLDEICLIPTPVSDIEHRKDVVVFDNHNNFPLFTAPMSFIDEKNYKTFKQNNINTIIPRTVNWNVRLSLLHSGEWVAVGLEEAKYLLENLVIKNTKIKLCIDQANGHMKSLLDVCANLKDKFKNNIRIMTGNIANPAAYREYARAGVDFVRVSIGSGNVCTTSVQTGIHYPIGSLIINCKKEKDNVEKEIGFTAKYRSLPKIVADGGFKSIDQIIKALALGADYVMLGEVFAKSSEAAGEIVMITKREYFGMSTEKAQILVNEASLFKVDDFVPKHTEGQVKAVTISYSIAKWLEDFEHALRSAMSYTGAKTLKQFTGNVLWDIMSHSTYNSYTYMK